MREDIAGPQGASSRPMWETFEGMVREKAQEFIQQIMEEEVTELLGREKSERRSTVDSAEGYRNGYGKPRRLAMSSGTITLRRPRVRGVEERFESRVLPLFARRTKELGALLPELYLHGLAEGDFELAMRGLLGEGAPLSKSSIRRLRAGWTAEFEEWSQRRLEGREVVYVWADGIASERAERLHRAGANEVCSVLGRQPRFRLPHDQSEKVADLVPYEMRPATLRSRDNGPATRVEGRLIPVTPETRSGVPSHTHPDISVDPGMDEQFIRQRRCPIIEACGPPVGPLRSVEHGRPPIGARHQGPFVAHRGRPIHDNVDAERSNGRAHHNPGARGSSPTGRHHFHFRGPAAVWHKLKPAVCDGHGHNRGVGDGHHRRLA